MKVTIKPFGIVRRYCAETSLELSGDLVAADLTKLLKIPHEIRPVVLVNNKRADSNKKLSDRDEIKIISLIIGG